MGIEGIQGRAKWKVYYCKAKNGNFLLWIFKEARIAVLGGGGVECGVRGIGVWCLAWPCLQLKRNIQSNRTHAGEISIVRFSHVPYGEDLNS